MEKMLWFQLIVAVLTLSAIFIFGEAGIKVFALIAISPFIYYYKWKKPDEREKYNFFKGTQIIVSILSIVLLVSVFILGVKLSDVSKTSYSLTFAIASIFIFLISVIRLYLNYKH